MPASDTFIGAETIFVFNKIANPIRMQIIPTANFFSETLLGIIVRLVTQN